MRRAVLAVLLALATAACGAERAEESADVRGAAFVAERRPDAWTPDSLLPDPVRRFPAGMTVVRIGGGGDERVLSEGLGTAGAPSVRHDGAAVVFVGREREGERLAVWTCGADGSGRRVAVRHPTDCLSAAFLPDGRIVYAATTAEPSPMPGVDRGAALFVAKDDGSPGARITFAAGLDADPCVLTDGRILFASWRASGTGGRLGLYTVFPDGSGIAPFHLADGDAVRPRQDADLDVTFALRNGGTASLRRASWDAPMSGAAQDGEGQADVATISRVPLAPRPRPQGQLSVVREDAAFGTLYCVDARRGAPGAVTVRVRAWDAAGKPPRVLGEAPLAADGSFHLRVPSNRPFAFEAIDAAGNVVAAEHGPIWVRGNEVRGCVGCHDDVETGPPNVRPAAVRLAPVDLSGAAGVVR